MGEEERTGSEALFGIFPHLPPPKILRLVPPSVDSAQAENRFPIGQTRTVDARTLEREMQLIGQHFGVLTVLRRLDTRSKNRWICKCLCGNPETRPKRLEDLFAQPKSCSFTCPLVRPLPHRTAWIPPWRIQK
jgi:hypothetical protein